MIFSLFSRGYTGHEYLDNVGLIHMNGRVYDPTLGRFLSANPNMQAPKNLQSLNCYSYVPNNPMTLVDPSGFIHKKIRKSVKRFVKKYGRTIVTIAVAVYLPSAMGLTGLEASLFGGFASGLVSGGDLKSGLVGLVTAGVFSGIHLSGIKGVGKVLAHGIVGGVRQRLSGGKFGAGFLAAAFTQTFSQNFDGALEKVSKIKRAFAAAIVGGTASVIGGGKFKNGAITGAFSRIFNDDAILNQRKAAFALAKKKGGIPVGQQPDVVNKGPQKGKQFKYIALRNHESSYERTRVYTFTRSDGAKVFIYDHAIGHLESIDSRETRAHFNTVIRNSNNIKINLADSYNNDHTYYSNSSARRNYNRATGKPIGVGGVRPRPLGGATGGGSRFNPFSIWNL